jgi:hypothetical protein
VVVHWLGAHPLWYSQVLRRLLILLGFIQLFSFHQKYQKRENYHARHERNGDVADEVVWKLAE